MSEFIELDSTVIPYLLKVIKKWKSILCVAIVFSILGFLFAKTQPKEYTVVTKLSPELSYRTNSLSSLAALAGVNTSMLNNTDALLPTVYPDIVESPSFLISLFDVPVTSSKVDTTLYVYMSEYTKSSLVSNIISLPFKALSSFIKLFSSKEDEEDESAPVDPFRLTKKQSTVVRQLAKSISTIVDKRTFMITITVKMQDPVVSAQVAESVMENLKEYISKYRTDKARMDLEYFQQMYDEAEDSYFKALQRYSYYMDSHQGVILQTVKGEQQKLQNDMNLKFQLYNSLAQQLQNAKAKVQQETPVFAEIMPPTVPTRKSKPRTIVVMFAFFVLGTIVGFIISFLRIRKEETIKSDSEVLC